MKRIIIVIMTAGCMISCQPSSQNTFSDADKEAIRKTAADAVAGFLQSHDYDAYANAYYAEDAYALISNNEAVQGRKAIAELLKGFGAMTISFEIKEINGSNDLAYVYGNYDLEFTATGVKDHGKYIEIWKRQTDGTWRASFDIPNTSVPLPVDAE